MPPEHRFLTVAKRAVRVEYVVAPVLVLAPVVLAALLWASVTRSGDVRALAFALIVVAATGLVNARMLLAFVRERRAR